MSMSLKLRFCPQGEAEEDEDQPLSLAWPDTLRKQITYLLILPIVLPLWLTLPDVRREVTKHTDTHTKHHSLFSRCLNVNMKKLNK